MVKISVKNTKRILGGDFSLICPFFLGFFLRVPPFGGLTIHRIPPSIAAMPNHPAVKSLETMEDVWDTYGADLNEVEAQIQKHLGSHASPD